MKRKLLLLLALMAIGLSGAWAYDFSAVAPSGQTLYYDIIGGNAVVTYPNSNVEYIVECWDGYSKPTGALSVPATVSYNGTTYSVTSIGIAAFAYCNGLTSVTIPNSVTSIGNSAFSGCSGLTGVTIGNSVTSIGNSAFYGCSGLTSVTIPNSVAAIGDYAFADCSVLTSVTIPNSVTSIGNAAFSGCSGLTSIVVASGNTAYDSRNNCNAIIETATNTLITGFQSTTIPNSVTSIGVYAFYKCSGLTSVTIPNSVTSIGGCAFYGCSGLTSVTIPNSVSSIENFAFYNCSGLTSVTIGNSVSSIENFAFYNCSGLTSVTMRGTVPPTLGASVFSHNASNRKIYVPCGAYDNYYNANNGWSNYRNYLSDPIVDMDVAVNADTERGRASIIPLRGQNIRCDSTVVVMATSNYGYHFDHWSTGSTQAQDTIAVSDNTVITAYFAKNQYAITLLSNDESMGSVNGGGTFDYLDTIALTATPMNHYHFVRWNNGNRENPRLYVVTEDETLTAYFAVDTHSVAVVSNDPTRGMVTSSGSEFEYLSPCTVTATAYTGFVFTGWSNGVTANPYTFAVQSDVELTAIFVSEDELMFTITVETDDPTMGSVSGGGMAMSGGEVTIHAVANEGYHFVRWNDNDTNADRTVIVTEDATYTAYFAADQTEGIDKVEQMPTIVVRGNSIAVGNAQGQKLSIYDITGRMIVREQAVEGKQYTMPHSGVYMVQVGNHPAEKVVVVR